MGDEELGSIGVGTRVCHRKNAGFVMAMAGVKFVGKSIAWPPRTCPSGVATLCHEVSDNTVKNGAVVETLVGEEDEIIDGIWNFISE